MSKEPTLAYTVHHKGRKYRAGMTAEEVGDVAGEFGDHVWEDGKGPGKSTSSSGADGGSLLGSPPVPTPSALPTPTVTSTTGGTAGGGDGDGGGDESGPPTPTITTGNRRRGAAGGS